MMMPWTVPSWPTVVWSPDAVDPHDFQHLATQVVPDNDGRVLRRGQTLWWASIADGDGAIAWDWIEIRRGVIAILDPLTLVSNIDIDDQFDQRMLLLNAWVHDMDWQPVVRATLRLNSGA